MFSGPESCTLSSPITKIIINQSVCLSHALYFTKAIIITMSLKSAFYFCYDLVIEALVTTTAEQQDV